MERTDRHRRYLQLAGRVLVPAAVGVGIVVFGVPLVAGVDWTAVGHVLDRVSAREVAVLTVIWLAGLWLQTIAIAAAMTGLTRRRAFFLNLTGSAASNLVPLGGTAGTALNYWSCRRWGYSVGAFIRWALVTNFWDNGVKLVLPSMAVSWMVLDGLDPGRRLVEAAVGGLVFFVAYVAMGWLLLHRPWGARALAGAADGIARRLGRTPAAADGYAVRAEGFRADTSDLVRAAYGRLTVGKLAYAAMQAVLLWACLASVGEPPTAVVAFSAFAVERLASLAVVTPGASGLAELGTVGVLVAQGVAPAPAVAGVLLYRAFVFWLEIPTGGALLGIQVLLQRRARRRVDATGATPTGPEASAPGPQAPSPGPQAPSPGPQAPSPREAAATPPTAGGPRRARW